MKPFPFLFSIIILSLLTVPTQINASAKSPHRTNTSSFESSEGWDKLDLRLRMAWRDSIAAGNKKVQFECLMKTTSPLTEDDKVILKDSGFKLRTVIGQIITGSVEAAKLPSVANLPLVQAMELAAPMSIKKKKDL